MTILSSISITEELKNLYNFLQNNAIPKYFDSVVFNESNDKINCTINGRQFLQFGTNPDFAVITLASGETTKLYLHNNGTISSRRYDCVYKCKNGFSIGTVNNAQISEPRLTITKDNAGNTAVIGGS